MNDVVTIALNGRIDSSNAAQIEKDIQAQLNGKDSISIVLDAKSLDYISSAGLRVLLRFKKIYPNITISNVNSEIYEILDMTGFTEILTVEKAYRVVSVEGCEVIGEGFNGKVYRIDHDNVVKTYKNADALSDIQHEREVARLALILGIPTAISYDVVKVNNSYGAVFELLDAKSFTSILAEEPKRFDWCVKEYINLLKKLHSTVVPSGKLPQIKTMYQNAVERISSSLPKELGEKLTDMIDAIPERETMIHGDYHTKNIVLAGDEVLLIDMDTLSVGHPIFELAQIYNSFIGFYEYDIDKVVDFQGFSSAVSHKFWKCSLRAYLDTDDIQAENEIENKIRCVAYIRLIDWSFRHHNMENADDKVTRELWIKELTQLLPLVDSLDFITENGAESNVNELVIEAMTENLPRVIDFVNQRLKAIDCPAKVQMQIEIATEEIFVNIANYAYAPNTGKAQIFVATNDYPRQVIVTFTDCGIAYNPLAKDDPDTSLSANEREIGGLGIFITKKSMDDISYEYKNGRNILTLKKNLA